MPLVRILRWLIVVLILGSCAPGPPPGGECVGTGTLTVSVGGFRNAHGVALVSLFRSARGFPDDMAEAVANRKVTIAQRRATVDFENLPCGVYAVSVHHDENDNARMDRNWLGIPQEGHGASNDPKGSFGPPDFAESRFFLPADHLTIKIFLQYLHRRR